MEKNCGMCGSNHFRLSRLRLSDVLMLFGLRYPIRCLRCMDRSYASFPWILEHKRKRAKRRRVPAD
jgi:hypothetical protein